METTWRKFNALGTEAVLTASLKIGEEGLLEHSEFFVADFEKRFSRFLADSELSQLNASTEKVFEGSEQFVALLTETKRLHNLTNGVFDPTIIGSLEKVGYDKSFSLIDPHRAAAVDIEQVKQNFFHRAPLADLKISGRQISKPAGLRLDFGGIGKGYLIDLLSTELFSTVENYWISIGGDLIVKGEEKPGEGWNIEVQNPHDPEHDIFSVKTFGSKLGIATSGIFKRKGQSGNFAWHHLIDPRTGLPVQNEIMAVTVLSSSATVADVFAKTVLILGEHEGLKFIEQQPDSAALIFLKNQEMIYSKKALNYF